MSPTTAGAPRAWKLLAWQMLQEFARTHAEFTTPEFMLLARVPKPPERRATGGLIRRAKKAGWIESTGRWEESDDPVQHRRPVPVWRSRIYVRGAA